MNENYGLLVQPNVELQRKMFDDMCHLLGVRVGYTYPLSKQRTLQGEYSSALSEETFIWAILNENVEQSTTQLKGWNAETLDKALLISVPYDTEQLQIGSIFSLPSAFDNAEHRKFRVSKLTSVHMYPASITCEIVPEYKSIMEQAETELFVNTNFNLLNEGD